MIDRTIPFYNTILRCDRYTTREPSLPEGFSIASYRPGFERGWARLEHGIGDFDTEREAEEYFVSAYLSGGGDPEDLLFLLDERGGVIGACFAWTDLRQEKPVNSLHWLVVAEEHQGKGLGRALCVAVMDRFARRNGGPVYIHTQPWSWKAIFLYLSLGFRLQKTDSFARYVNQYPDAMRTLAGVVDSDRYRMLTEASDE